MSAGYSVRLRLLAAFRYLLVPLVRILLRNGISFNEISEVLKGGLRKSCSYRLRGARPPDVLFATFNYDRHCSTRL